MMISIGSFEAKKNLSSLLERVQQGERFTITKRGSPIAQLVPIESQPSRQRVEEVIARIKESRQNRPRVSQQEIREMIEEGRR